MDTLHEPLTLILRHILVTTSMARNGRVLDLASGAGLKLPLLAEACGPDVTFIALDHDRAALAEPGTARWEQGDKETRRQEEPSSFSSVVPSVPSHPLTRSPAHRIAADAHALPLADDCCVAACCIAALGLFAEPVAVLRELRRVVQPGGALLIVSGTQAWTYVTRWPAALVVRLTAAYAQAQADGMPAPSAPDLGDDLAALLGAAGWRAPHTRAFLFDAGAPVQAELALLPWPTLRQFVAARLDLATLTACDEAAAHNEIELCSLVLAAVTPPN